MPSHVGNSIIVTGPEEEISRLFSRCFRMRILESDDEGDEE
ncbi:MAG: hypothetical protein AB7L90_19040 [Hyphomicrobiaceae bacterium]